MTPNPARFLTVAHILWAEGGEGIETSLTLGLNRAAADRFSGEEDPASLMARLQALLVDAAKGSAFVAGLLETEPVRHRIENGREGLTTALAIEQVGRLAAERRITRAEALKVAYRLGRPVGDAVAGELGLPARARPGGDREAAAARPTNALRDAEIRCTAEARTLAAARAKATAALEAWVHLTESADELEGEIEALQRGATDHPAFVERTELLLDEARRRRALLDARLALALGRYAAAQIDYAAAGESLRAAIRRSLVTIAVAERWNDDELRSALGSFARFGFGPDDAAAIRAGALVDPAQPARGDSPGPGGRPAALVRRVAALSLSPAGLGAAGALLAIGSAVAAAVTGAHSGFPLAAIGGGGTVGVALGVLGVARLARVEAGSGAPARGVPIAPAITESAGCRDALDALARADNRLEAARRVVAAASDTRRTHQDALTAAVDAREAVAALATVGVDAAGLVEMVTAAEAAVAQAEADEHEAAAQQQRAYYEEQAALSDFFRAQHTFSDCLALEQGGRRAS